MKKLKLVFVIVLGVIMLILLTACNGGMDLYDGGELSINGISGGAQAQFSVSGKYIEQNAKNADMSKLFAFQSSIEYEINPKNNLKNGDDVEVKIICNQNLAKELGFKVSKSKKYKVDGLEEGVALDPFADVEVKVDFQNNRIIIINNSDDENIKEISYNCKEENPRELKDGDVVTIDATVDINNNKKLYLTQNTKEFALNDIGQYVNNKEMLNEAKLDNIHEISKQEIVSSIKSKTFMPTSQYFSKKNWELIDFKYIENSFKFIEKETSFENNSLFMIYEVKINNDGEQKDYYVYLKYRGIYLDKDNNIMIDFNYKNDKIYSNTLYMFRYPNLSDFEINTNSYYIELKTADTLDSIRKQVDYEME